MPRRKPVRTRRALPVLLLDLSPGTRLDGVMGALPELGWKPYDLRHARRGLPADLNPIGSIVESPPTDSSIKALRRLGRPIVRISPFGRDSVKGLPTVSGDLSAYGRQAAEFFAERGFRHLAYVGQVPWSSARNIYEGFKARGEELGCETHLLRLKPIEARTEAERDRRYEIREKEIGAWLGSLPRPIGFLAYHDSFAGTLCGMCLDSGLSVPEEVAILGIGNVLYECEAAPVPLSSIDAAGEEIGRQAALLVKRLAEGKPPPKKTVLVSPRGVVERRSTDVLAVKEPAVARALRFMWDHIDTPLSVDEIAREACVSRRTLSRAFHRCLGRTVNAELQRKRLEVCCRLLTTTDLGLAEIAAQLGLGSTAYLYQFFHKAHGMAPGAYRRKNRVR